MDASHADSPHPIHAVFLAILPRIERHGRVYFRHVKNAGLREEFIAEMVALAWKWCVRLAQKGKDVSRFPSAVATFAARAVHSGRRLCGQENGKDVLSPLAQRRHGFAVDRLPDYGTPSDDPLHDALRDNTQSLPAEAAAFRCDFPLWLAAHAERDRRLALDLMAGERTLDAAQRFGLSAGRVSQKRREFHDDWRRFHGEPTSSTV